MTGELYVLPFKNRPHSGNIQNDKEQQHYPINQPRALSSTTCCLAGNSHKGRRIKELANQSHAREESSRKQKLDFQIGSNKKEVESSKQSYNSRAGPQKTCPLSFGQTSVTAMSRTGLTRGVGHRRATVCHARNFHLCKSEIAAT